MPTELNTDTWLWVIVQNPEKNPGFLGQHDTKTNIKFIPAFLEKDAALMCMNQLVKNQSLDYQPQAIFYDELLRYVDENNFFIYILDKTGNIIDKINP